MNIKRRSIILLVVITLMCSLSGCESDEDIIEKGHEAQKEIQNSYNQFKQTEDAINDLADTLN